MRVLVTDTDVHCWLHHGQFTIHGDGAVTWRTPYDPMKDFARIVDDDIVVVPGLEGALPLRDEDVVDVLVLDDLRAAVARREPARVEITELTTGKVLETIALTGRGPRVPTIRDDEEWCEDQLDFQAGYGARGIRLFPATGGFLVTARDSGHIARYTFATRSLTIWRVPGVPENTYYAVEGAKSLIVGVKWNGRHSELIALEGGAAWPANKEEVRWGMPAPIRVGDHVITYSDEGPHAGELALLDATSLEEVDHVELPSWPADAHAHGTRFATVSGTHVAIGHVENGRLSVEVFAVDALMDKAGVAPPPRSTQATDDGRGSRTWLDYEVTWLGYDGDTPLVARRSDLATVALESEGERVIIPGSDKPAGIWDAPTVPQPLHARGGRLLAVLGDRMTVTDLVTGEQVTTSRLAKVERAWLVSEGVFHVRESKDPSVLDDGPFAGRILTHGYTPFGGATRELSTSSPTFAPREVFAIAGKTVWWCERSETGEYALCHFTIGDATSVREPPIQEPRAIGLRDGVLYVLKQDDVGSGQALYRREGNEFLKVASAELPYFLTGLAVTDTHAYSIEPITHGADGIAPSKLYRIELATGTVTVISTSTVGQLAGLHLADGELRWYESGAGETAICRLPLDV